MQALPRHLVDGELTHLISREACAKKSGRSHDVAHAGSGARGVRFSFGAAFSCKGLVQVWFHCTHGRAHAAHHSERHLGRVDHRQLCDPQSKRPKPAQAPFSCPGPEFLLAACASVNSCRVWRRRGSMTTNQGTSHAEGLPRPAVPSSAVGMGH